MNTTKKSTSIACLILLTLFFTSGLKFSVNANSKFGEHPAYMRALSDLRAARWMLDHRPGNWVQSMDESQAVNEIDKAIDEIKRASIDDGKDVNWHPAVDEHPAHADRLKDADDFLRKARQDISQEEDNGFANGLRNRAYNHIDAAMGATERAMRAFTVARPVEHPNYIEALSDLRAARWMLDHRPGNWEQSEDEMLAIKEIDRAIDEIKKASIDDGKDVNWHPAVDEHPAHADRLKDAQDFLRKARQDISKEEDNAFANGLRDRAYNHIDAAMGATDRAIRQVRY